MFGNLKGNFENAVKGTEIDIFTYIGTR